MDKDIRNKLQRATQAARALIENEYGEQLEGTFDLRLDGTISSAPGEHLDAHQQVLWSKLVAAIGHLEAGGEKKPEAVQAYLRESAFTTLNRFVALKMLEARGLVLESVSQGDQSSGFREFTGLAPGLVQLPDHGYRLYIESLFDEIGREVRVLFDRRDPASLLWPRRQALQDLLEILNAPELASVWIEDETIGWVYQYFNGEDERKAMREASQAPRNSRELAVRNQFFTPRYVVQFLVDNTLGRTWFEMMRGETTLKGLDYLVRRQHEVFLNAGEAAPEEPEGVNFGETPEHPFPVLFRAKKDPRDLKILDPACGSGHFLLYTFDLLLSIYEEAWQDEGAATSQVTGATLRADYPELEALRNAAPELILRHNLHGIDIDPRAAQIAALALWLRAQRAFQAAELSRTQRPSIAKTNIVVAEPMPGEADLREAFVATLEPKLGKLVERAFDLMRLAGDAGCLLRIAETMEELIRQVYGGGEDMFSKQDEDRWTAAAKELSSSLSTFANSAAADQAFTRQLFAGDAARGLGFIEVCSQRYDTLLMNPPFGEPTRGSKELLRTSYDLGRPDLYACFMRRAIELLVDGGRVGAITSRTFHTLEFFEGIRRDLLTGESPLDLLADMGSGVLDSATVETSLWTRQARSGTPSNQSAFVVLDLEQASDRGHELRSTIAAISTGTIPATAHIVRYNDIAQIPGGSFAYRLPPVLRRLFGNFSPLAPQSAVRSLASETEHSPNSNGRAVLQGLIPGDMFRFCRLRWEVDTRRVGPSGDWVPLMKGGEYQKFFSHEPFVIAWRADGEEIRAFAEERYGGASRTIKNDRYFFLGGLTYPRVGRGLGVRQMPPNAAFSDTGMAIIGRSEPDNAALLGYLNSRLAHTLADSLHPGRKFEVGHISALPDITERIDSVKCEEIVNRAVEITDSIDRLSNPARGLAGDDIAAADVASNGDAIDGARLRLAQLWGSLAQCQRKLDQLVSDSLGLGRRERTFIRDRCTVSESSGLSAQVGLSPESYEASNASDRLPSGHQLARRWFTQILGAIASSGPSHGVIGVDDPGHPSDLESQLSECSSDFERSSCLEPLTSQGSLRSYTSGSFFGEHISDATRRPRKAPIYWQLATPSASYSAWIYYHGLNRDTFFRLLNDHVTPKLQHEERKLTNLTQDPGPNPTASQRKEIDEQTTFVGELRAFRDEVARIAPLWNPNLKDGVILNFAPLWRLVPQHKGWQKDCKSAWDKLCKGDYEWAHLAMHLWPERVVPKCAEDRSLAIAHGLEEVFWREDQGGKWQPKTISDEEVEALVAERMSPAVKSALKSLLEAPAPVAGRGRTPRRKKTTTHRAKAAAPSGASVTSREQTSRRSTSTRIPDATVLDQIRSAIATLGGNAAKSDILESTRLSASQWTPAINALLAEGSVTKTGQKRGTRYHLAQGPS